MEDHSGVADRTVFSVDSAVARVKGKHHDGDVLSWMAYYAVKSGGTASSLVLLDDENFFLLYKKFYFKEDYKCTTKFLIT